MKRKICVVSGSRADYGLLRLVMQKIKENPHLDLQLIVTGMHLSEIFGFTVNEIESDGFAINRRIECLSSSDDPISIAEATSKSLVGCSRAFTELSPDIVLILGDRFEILGATVAALFARIPVAHIHGGELTLGSYDESMRHAITKMSHIHFVANEVYRKRLVQLGEVPKSIYLVGGLGVDSINKIKLLDRKKLEESLRLKFKQKSLLVTFHPSTLEDETPTHQMLELLSALSGRKDTTIIFTLPNSDTGGLVLIKLIEDFVQANSNCYAFKSLGQLLYLSCMAQVNGVVGNSSSGITEAPVLKKGTINIGMRQFGRVQSTNVINCSANRSEIENAILKLYSRDFQEIVRKCESPHGDGGASERIIDILCEVDLKGLTRKTFYDLGSSS